MIRLLSAAALAAICLFSLPSAAHAKASLPQGSYLDSCRNLYIDGKTIYGECVNKRGKWKKTWISGYMYCDGDIANNDGVLDCNGGRKTVEEATGRAPASTRPDLPPGPWIDTCRDAVVDGSVLRASCRDLRGTWRPTWIDLRQCRDGEIANEDGLLICIPAPSVIPMRDTLPGGTWPEACRSAAVQNFQMRAECFDGVKQWFVTDLNLKSCKGGAVNVRRGRLVCG